MVDHSDPRILEMYDAGKELKEIAGVIGCSESSVHRILKEHGRSPFQRRYPHAEDRDTKQMFLDYQNEMLFADLLKKHHISCTHFHRLRKAADIPLRKRIGACGPRNYQYKHGRGNSHNPNHSRWARQIVASYLGYDIPKGWQVHHMDENTENNNIENLALFPSRSEHAKYHQRLLRLQRKGLPTDASQLVLENDGFLLRVSTRPIALSRERDQPSLPKSQVKPTLNQIESEQEKTYDVQQLEPPRS